MNVYSFTPLPEPLGYTGFAICFVIALVIVALIGYWRTKDSDEVSTLFQVLTLTLVVLATAIVAVSSCRKQPENIKTVGTFVEFRPEGYREQTGKSRSNVHYLYVVYRLPNGNTIMLPGIPGADYPKHVILYGNKL